VSNTTSEVPKEIRDKYKSGSHSSMVTPLSSVHGVHVVNKRLSTNNKVSPLGMYIYIYIYVQLIHQLKHKFMLLFIYILSLPLSIFYIQVNIHFCLKSNNQNHLTFKGTIPSGLPSEPETTLPSTDPSAESYRAAGKEATIGASDYK
jgi:hypothetical protein